MSLADRIGVPSVLPSVSVIDVPQRPVQEAWKDEERALEERAKMESGKVERYYDPAAFEWLLPLMPQKSKLPRGVRFAKAHIVILECPEVADWEYVQLGFTPRAVALRKAEAGKGWMIRREPKAKLRQTWRIAMPRVVLDRLQAEGWPLHETLPAEWDARNKMLVVPKPQAGRRAR